MFSLGTDAPTSAPPATRLASLVSGSNMMLPEAYWHPNPARNALGLFAGNDVSPIAGNLVNLESELRGITRDLSRDPSKKGSPWTLSEQQSINGFPARSDSNMTPFSYQASAPPPQIYFTDRETGKLQSIATAPRHLPTKQYVSYPGVPRPAPLIVETHGAPWRF